MQNLQTLAVGDQVDHNHHLYILLEDRNAKHAGSSLFLSRLDRSQSGCGFPVCRSSGGGLEKLRLAWTLCSCSLSPILGTEGRHDVIARGSSPGMVSVIQMNLWVRSRMHVENMKHGLAVDLRRRNRGWSNDGMFAR
ncbi:hypothetical protein ONS96_014948 [Cadophora gregata f. sp. sojae]|nr:hypothetical protein ONS96_014948 [Cadophora gregata f. sp. sojae]